MSNNLEKLIAEDKVKRISLAVNHIRKAIDEMESFRVDYPRDEKATTVLSLLYQTTNLIGIGKI